MGEEIVYRLVSDLIMLVSISISLFYLYKRQGKKKEGRENAG